MHSKDICCHNQCQVFIGMFHTGTCLFGMPAFRCADISVYINVPFHVYLIIFFNIFGIMY